MRLRGRWMLNGLTALSLLLWVATCGLWVRSYWKADGIERASGWERTSVAGVVVHWRQTQLISELTRFVLLSGV